MKTVNPVLGAPEVGFKPQSLEESIVPESDVPIPVTTVSIRLLFSLFHQVEKIIVSSLKIIAKGWYIADVGL